MYYAEFCRYNGRIMDKDAFTPITKTKGYDTITSLRKYVVRVLSEKKWEWVAQNKPGYCVIIYKGNQEYASIKYEKTIHGMRMMWEVYDSDIPFPINSDGSLNRRWWL